MRARLVPAAIAGLALALAGCGSDDPADDETSNTSGSAGEVSVATLHGTLTLDQPAVDIVALEWSLAEDLLALGIEPAGVADVEGYGTWVAAGPQLGEDVVDVGDRQEPSLEQIEALEPDLILTDDDRTGGDLTNLEAIAPTYSSDFYGQEGGQLQTMRDTFSDIATLTGTEDQAGEALAELDTRTEEFAASLAGAEVPPTFVLAQGYTFEGAATIGRAHV